LEQVRQYASDAGVANVVHFLGVRADMPRLMGGADMMLLPSYFEGFPVVLVESQTVGLPAIVSDKVADEVDLGLELVKFVSIDNGARPWMDAIAQLRNHNRDHNPSQRLAALRSLGFDVAENAQRLTAVYLAAR
jgi:glycosyltransferase EpsF